jgi:hypothetical protein
MPSGSLVYEVTGAFKFLFIGCHPWPCLAATFVPYSRSLRQRWCFPICALELRRRGPVAPASLSFGIGFSIPQVASQRRQPWLPPYSIPPWSIAPCRYQSPRQFRQNPAVISMSMFCTSVRGRRGRPSGGTPWLREPLWFWHPFPLLQFAGIEYRLNYRMANENG